jgi:hypothetical protein
MNPDIEDASVEQFARVTPPSGHEARVRARSGPGAADAGVVAHTPTGVAWRWVMPVAASLLVVVGAVWQSNRAARQVEVAAPAAPATWSGKGVDVPVLPPRAYWEMSALDEFEQLRATARRDPAPATTDGAREASTASDRYGVASNWTPLPSSLPPIEIEDIAPAAIEIPPVVAPAPITLAPIDIAPIDIGLWDKERE